MGRTAIVLGAGMVGVCCALSLQRRGWRVTLIDRKAPGRETSYGNSGVLSRSSVFPINGPGMLRQLPVYLANRHPAVRWRASMLRQPGWVMRFLGQCTAASQARRSVALDALIRLSMDLNRTLIAEAGLQAHLRETGWLKVWRGPGGGDAARAESRALARFGIATEVLDCAAVTRLEPDAAAVFSAGLLTVGSASVDDPGAVVTGYAQHFRTRDGTIVTGEVRALYRTTTGWRAETTAGSHDGDDAIVALGPWSADLLRPLGVRLPLQFERGYHVNLEMPEMGRGPRRAVYDVDGGYVVSPMRDGARVTSGVELAARDTPPNTSQIDRAALLAARTFGLGARVEKTPWIGSRPTLPDCLPMVGPLPHLHGLHIATGHQHIGFSTGAGTGEIIAAEIAGEAQQIDTSAFAPGRYLR